MSGWKKKGFWTNQGWDMNFRHKDKAAQNIDIYWKLVRYTFLCSRVLGFLLFILDSSMKKTLDVHFVKGGSKERVGQNGLLSKIDSKNERLNITQTL